MALAGDHQNVAFAKRRNAGADRLGAVSDFLRAGTESQRFPADRGGFFAARIVVGDDDTVGELRRRRAHQHTLALVAIAAAAEHDVQFALGVRAQRGQDGFERIGRMGVIDIDRRAAFRHRDFLQTARRAFETGKRRKHGGRVFAKPDGKGGRNQRIGNLESSGQGNATG